MGPTNVVQEYCLKWNNHHSTLVNVLDLLLKQESLCDVTLAAEGKSVKVHRLVLCACSTYFKELLCQQWDKQTVVFLKDVKFNQLKALVDYMYRGEVNVSQDQLAAFLSTAEALKIKGLADGDKEGGKKQSKRLPASTPSAPTPSPRPAKRARKPSKEAESAPPPAVPLPSLVRIPPPVDAAVEISEPSNNANSTSDPLDDQDANADSDPGRSDSPDIPLGGLQPKIETEDLEEALGSGDEENWSDNEHSNTQGEHSWGEGINASGGSDLYGASQSATENEDSNTPLGGIVNSVAWHEAQGDQLDTPRKKSRRKMLPNDQGRFECHHCGRSYNLYGNLRRHWRYDCGDQPPQFACTRCGRLFRRRSNLHAHAIRNNCQRSPVVLHSVDIS